MSTLMFNQRKKSFFFLLFFFIIPLRKSINKIHKFFFFPLIDFIINEGEISLLEMRSKIFIRISSWKINPNFSNECVSDIYFFSWEKKTKTKFMSNLCSIYICRGFEIDLIFIDNDIFSNQQYDNSSNWSTENTRTFLLPFLFFFVVQSKSMLIRLNADFSPIHQQFLTELKDQMHLEQIGSILIFKSNNFSSSYIHRTMKRKDLSFYRDISNGSCLYIHRHM